MIKTASELLTAFIETERKEIESVPMRHMPTLGEAYELIISSGIDAKFVLPVNLDLRVVSGFIDGLKNQIDCMLVRGEGRRYGRTDKFIYPIEQVLCVVEVKKTMHKAALVDGIGHLADVQRHFNKYFSDAFAVGKITDFEQARSTFSKLTGRAAPDLRNLDASPVEDRLMFRTLARQIYAPVTVLLGFDGYRTEEGLREALVDFVDDAVGSRGNASPDMLPSLISVGRYSLVKCTGQPYFAWDEQWVTVVSARHNPAWLLLEFLWTKIQRFCKVKMPFGKEVEVETLVKLLVAKGVELGGKTGWEVRAASRPESQLKQRPATRAWQPIRLNQAAITVTDLVAAHNGVLELDMDVREYIQRKHAVSLDEVVADLLRTLAFRLRGTCIEIMPPAVTVATLEDETGYASTDEKVLLEWCSTQGLDAIFVNIGEPESLLETLKSFD